MQFDGLIGRYVRGKPGYGYQNIYKGEVVGAYVRRHQSSLLWRFFFGDNQADMLVLVVRTPEGVLREIILEDDIEIQDDPFE